MSHPKPITILADLDNLESNLAELHCHYDGQTDPQPVYLDFDPAERQVTIDRAYSIGPSVPFPVFHGTLRRYRLPLLTGPAAAELLRDPNLHELLDRLADGYEATWTGSDWTGSFDDQAEEAETELERFLEALHDRPELILEVWDGGDWIGRSSDAELGIHAGTTDQQLEELAEQLEGEAEAARVYVTDLLDALTARRQAARDAQAEAAEHEAWAAE